jgi:ferrous-iron efflux pump FieF
MGTPVPPDEAERARLMRRATLASITVAMTLVAGKLAAYLQTGSAAVLSSMVDSLLDFAASAVNWLAVRHALEPADDEHRFGHGKAEPLAGLAQAGFIAASALFLAIEAVGRLIDPRPIANMEIGLGVSLIGIVLTFGLVLYQRRVVRRTGSLAIASDELHYRGDLLVNLGVIAALVAVTEFGFLRADPMFAGVIAAIVLASAIAILRRSYDMLMDRELPDEARRRIVEIVTAEPGVDGVHDLRTRASGPATFIQLHLELDPAMTLIVAHEISDRVEARLAAAFPGAEVIVHQDPFPEARELALARRAG